MKTPLKKQQGPIQQNKLKSSLKHSTHQKKIAQQFNPSLYITPTITEDDVIQIKEAFDYYDSNHTGILTPNDLKLALFNQNFHATRETVYNIISEYDEQCLGGLTFPAFIQIITSDPIKLESIADLKKIFRKYDRDNKGYIDIHDIAHMVKSLNQSITPQELQEIFNTLDYEHTSKIRFQNFVAIMHNPKSFQ